MKAKTQFWCGVVEGFYGRPWSEPQRLRLFAWMHGWGLNTYLYAPKDDLKHRTRWRAPYSGRELRELGTLLKACRRREISFVYAIGPGLDLRYTSWSDREALRRKLDQLWQLGGRHFALLFDDIPDTLSAADRQRFASFAEAQSDVANSLCGWLRGRDSAAQLLFCPTAYCGRMAGPKVSRSGYLRELGRKLDPAVAVLWTGPEIISETIPIASILELSRVLERTPVLWDNLHANDYDRRRIHLGPYAGRSLALREEVAGILCNPNCEFEANYVPLATLARYARTRAAWQPRRVYRAALRAWLPAWRTHGGTPIDLADLELLGDCLYLPHVCGAHAERWLADLRSLQAQPPSRWGRRRAQFLRTCARLEALFVKMTALRDRDLLHTFYRFLWDLKEEAILLRNYVAWLAQSPSPQAGYDSPEHRPGIYRGGLMARLQRLLPLEDTGAIRHPSLASRKGL